MSMKTMTQDERVQHMTTAPIPRLICEMSVPTVISMLVSSFYNMVDTLFVGQLDTQSTAAVGVAFSMMSLIQAVSFFFGQGSGNYMSRALGARRYEDAEKMAATGFFSALLVGIVGGILGVVFIDPISMALGSTETILPYTVRYLSIIFIGAPFMMGSFVLNNQMRYQGSASIAMVGIVTGAVLNIALDPLLIFVLDMGVAGAALATIISQFISFTILLVLNLRQAAIKVKLKSFTPNAHYIKNIFNGGVPSLCRQGIGSFATISMNTAAKLYGGPLADAAIAAMGVCTRITMFAFSALIGFGQGFQPVCGTNYGAGKNTRVREAFWFCVKIGVVILAVTSALGIVFAEPLITLFRNDPDVIRLGSFTLRCMMSVFTLNAFSVMCNMLTQTMGRAVRASILSAARQGIFFIPLIFILPQFLGLRGVQMTQMIADICSFLLAIPLVLPVLEELKQDANETV